MTARVIQAIEAIGLRGTGTVDDPHRTIRAWFTLEGELLCEYDPFADTKRAGLITVLIAAGERALHSRQYKDWPAEADALMDAMAKAGWSR